MMPAIKTIDTSSATAATPAADIAAPATAFDAILTLETLAATIAAVNAPAPPTCLEGVCLEGLAEDEWTDEDAESETEDGEGVDALAFLADLLNVSVPRQAPARPGDGELAANDDVMTGAAKPSVEQLLSGDAATDKQLVVAEAALELVDAAQPVDEVTSLSRAAEWVAGPRHAPPGPERAGIATHVRDPRWAEEFGTRIALMVRGAESSASLQLSPVELGPMDVSVTIRDSQASIHFGAAQAETRALIEASIPRLREMLATQGFQLADASVSQGFSRQPRSDVPPTLRSTGDSEADASVTTRATLGLLDLYA
jgi:hypothetical protein